MKQIIIILTFFLVVVQVIACDQNDLWENFFKSNTIESVASKSNTAIEVVFENEVDKTTSENPLNYFINNDLEAISAERDSVDFTVVMVTTGSMTTDEYELIITNVEELGGKLIDTTDNPNTFIGDALPIVQGVVSSFCTGVRVTFSEDVVAGSDVAGNYVITDETDSILPAISCSVSGNVVDLVTASQSENANYTLIVNNVQDSTSNVVDPSNNSCSFTGDAPPELVDVASLSNTSARITFSETLDPVSANIAGNYSIPGLAVNSVIQVFESTVDIETGSQTNISYTVTVANVLDSTGNSIGTINSDTFTGDALPYVVSAVSSSNTGVTVVFSENMKSGSVTDEDNYQIPGLTVSNAEYVSDGTVQLTTSFQSGIDYTLTVVNVQDATGNFIDLLQNFAAFTGNAPFCVANVVSIDNTHVDVTFTNYVQKLSGEFTSNYTFSDGLTVADASRDTSDLRIIHLTTDSQSAITYTLTAIGVVDVLSAPLNSPNYGDFFGDAQPILSSVVRDTDNIVRITYSESVTGLENSSNYSIVDLVVKSLSVVSETEVEIETNDQTDGVNYEIVVSSVYDLTGNVIDPANDSGSFIGDSRPEFIDVVRNSNNLLLLTFSEEIDEASAENKDNYFISNSLSFGIPIKISSDTVQITTNYQEDIVYSVIVSNITDTTGNSINPDHCLATFMGNGSPIFLSVASDGSIALIVYFSEDMLDNATSYSANYDDNYILRNTETTDISALINNAYLDSSDKKVAHITLDSNLPEGNYELEILMNVQDADGNNLKFPRTRSFLIP